MKFSTILPVYNRAPIVAQALTSVLTQTRPPDEVIVVDDGSTDDLATALAPFAGRITLIRQPNAGVAAARNVGCAAATGDWLTFQDSDDLWTPDHLAVVARDLTAATPDVVCHIGNVDYVGANYRQDLFSLKRRTYAPGHAVRVDPALPLVISGMTLQGSAVRRDVFARVGGFDETMRLYEDSAFFCQLALEGPFLVTGDTLADIRRLDDDATSLTVQEGSDPRKARALHVRYLTALLPRDLSPDLRDCVNIHLAGAEFMLAQVTAATDPAAARRLLWSSARRHPKPRTGWGKAAVALLMGPRGYAMILDRNKSFDRK